MTGAPAECVEETGAVLGFAASPLQTRGPLLAERDLRREEAVERLHERLSFARQAAELEVTGRRRLERAQIGERRAPSRSIGPQALRASGDEEAAHAGLLVEELQKQVLRLPLHRGGIARPRKVRTVGDLLCTPDSEHGQPRKNQGERADRHAHAARQRATLRGQPTRPETDHQPSMPKPATQKPRRG